ncbi:hypothetical protein HKCCE2091_05185 [Rhodobacterales bacterium HKCCE2091]|nr:hypothetical protein [Rhodobacterales bacterium HKCCE2091]
MRSRFVMAAAALAGLAGLSGCFPVTTWHREGVSVAARERDVAQCDARAFAAYPVAARTRVSPPVFHPPVQVCDAAGTCVTRPGWWEPGETYTVDLNEAPREASARACMAARGYTEVRLPPCEGGPIAAPRIMPPITGESCAVARGPEGTMIVTP